MDTSKEGTSRSPTSVIGERLGQLGGYFFACLSISDQYEPSPDENDLVFDVLNPPMAEKRQHSSLPEQEIEEPQQAMRQTSECVTRSNTMPSQQNLMTCNGCEKRIYPTDSITRAFSPTRTFHIGCFKCYLCQGTLKHHGAEVCFQIPDDDYSTSLILLCLPCQQKSLSKYSDKTEATIAGKRVEPTKQEIGDVNGVLEDIGDDLERVMMEHYVPTCTICGGNFLSYNSNKVVLLGPTLKYHYECWETGKPSVEVQQRKLEPFQAVKYLPNELIVRIKSEMSVSTLYFVWKNRLDDVKEMIDQGNESDKLTARYSIDQQTITSATSYLPWTPGAILYTFELVGEPLGKICSSDSTTTITSNADGSSEASGSMQLTRFELNHVIHIEIPILHINDLERLDLQQSSLAIILSEN
jgi:hypothetical protein